MALGPLIVDIEGTELSAADRELLAHPLIGGVILFSRNYVDRAQLAALTDAIHRLRQPPLLIAVDHEGGRVQRFREGFTRLPPAATLGERFDESPRAGLDLARDLGQLLALELRTAGVDFSFTPVLDLHSRASAVIGDRALHRDPQVVGRLAQALVRGLRTGGMAAIGKHFPGHGGVPGDSHLELPVDTRGYVDLAARDLLPFKALIGTGLEGIMPAHVLYPEIDSRPAGFSAIWLQRILRGELGFRGAVISDDICMAGARIAGSHADRARAALHAGCDAVLICNNRQAVHEVLAELPVAPNPAAQVRLMRLHGRPAPCTDAERTTEARWLALSARVAACNAAPELSLGEDAPV